MLWAIIAKFLGTREFSLCFYGFTYSLICTAPAKVRICVPRVEADSLIVVLYRLLVFPKTVVCEAPVAVGGIGKTEPVLLAAANNFVVVLYRLLVFLKAVVCITSTVVGENILWVEGDGLVEILYSQLVLLQYKVGKTSVVVDFGMLRVEGDGLVKILYSPLVLV